MAKLRNAFAVAALVTAVLLSLAMTATAVAAANYGCQIVALNDTFQRSYRRNPGLQGASFSDIPITLESCLLHCATQEDTIAYAAYSHTACFCGNENYTSLESSVNCGNPYDSMCPASNDSCFITEQTVYQALVQNPIFNATLLASSTQLRTPTTIFAELPKADVSASARFPVTIRAVDVDEQASISQHFTVPISNQLTDSTEIPVRPTFSNRRGLVYVKFTTPEAEEHKTKSYKVYYPISAQLSLELDFANNTPGYYPVMEEFRATVRISLGSNLSTIFNFGDGTAKQFSNLPDTFPVTYRRSVAFNESNDAIWTDPEHSVTVFSSFRIDSNITITTVVPLVRPVAQPATIAVLALRPVCSSGSVYCNRANACTNNCSALPGARSVACGSGSAWSTNRRICRSGSAQDSSLFADGYYVHQSVAANLTSPSASHYFQTVYLPGGGLSLIPGDLLALYDPNGAVACENSTLTEVNLNETEHLLSWNTSFADFTLDGATVRRVTLATLNSGARRSVKAVQFFGNRQLSVLGNHRFANVGCNWTTSYCNDEYPFNITASIVSGVDGQTAVSKLPLIVQIPLINVTFEAPLYYTSHTKVPYQIGSHSGSKPVYSWSVNASLTDFNSSMLANSGYSFASDGFYNVCLTTVNHVSSFFVCHTVIIQHPLLNDTTFIVPDLLLATTPTSPALSTIYFTWNASNSDVPTNVSAIIDPADGGNPVFVLVDWSTSRRVVEYKRNYSRGVYIRKIEMFNQVSRQVSNTSLVVQEAIMGPVLTASAYVVRPGQVVTYTLNLVWGSDYTVTINFGDGNSQTVTVNDNNHTTTFTHTFAGIGNYSASCSIVNRVTTSVTAQLDRTVVEVMFVPAGFELLASFIKLLRRPENMTDTRLQLCRNSTINALEPLYSVFYDIDLGDGSLAATGIALVSCDTSNTANNDACTGQFGPGFVHCQFAPTQQYRHPGNFTATVRLYNKAGSQTLTWSQRIYSQIVNLNRNITLYPGMYTGNTPVHDMSRTYAYPIEHPLKFFAITQFGHLSPLYYNWDFGDGHTAVTTVNWIEHKFDKPLLFTVRVNVTNPLVWQADSYNIELKRSVIDVTIGAKVAMPMDYPYEVTMDFAAFPTNTCFIIDFSNFGTRVVNNGSKHMFGFEAFCNSDPYFSSRKSQCYWDTELTDYYLNGYLESLTGSAFSRTTFFKNFENYGAETVTLHAANSFSSLDYSWTMTVSKGFCSIPVPNLAARFTKTRYKRNQVVEIGGDMKISCYNVSTHVKWTVEEFNNGSGLWTDYGAQLQAFYTKHRSSENLQNLLEGDWFGPTNIHLRLLTLPAFSLRFSKAYRVCAQLTMNDEPTINATECVTFYVYKAPVEPCLQFKYSKDNITWNDLEDPAQAPYGSLLSFDASCSVNPNKFDADGELPCWSVATYCRHDCEPMKFGPNYAYNASEQTLACKKLKIDGGYVHESTCFISQALVTWHYLKPMGLEDWMKVNVTTSSYPNEVVKGVYDRIPGWKDQAAIGKYNFLYYMHNGIVYVDTKFSFEGDAIHFTLVIKDTCDDLLPEPVSATLKITRGEPPIVSGVCVSNCFRRKIPHKKLNGNACGYKSISVNPKVVTKFQMRIENYVAGIDYGFFWQCTPLNSSLKVCPSDLSSTALDDGFNQMELDNKYWTQKDGVEYASTGRTSSGLSIDPPNFFPEGDGYYIIRLRAWRGSDSTNYGFKFLYISVNQGPNASKISTSIYPANGESMKTKFFFSCTYPSSTTEDERMIYTVGYSFEQTPTKRADCYPLILNSPTCEVEAKLPAGQEANNYTLTICVSVFDGAYSEAFHAQTRVRVTPRAMKSEEFQSNSPFFTDIIGAGKSGSVVSMAQIALPLLSAINQVSKDASGAANDTDPVAAEKRRKERSAAKALVVDAARNAIESFNPNASETEQLQTLQLSGEMLKGANSVPNEISESSKENTVAAGDLISKRLVDLSSSEDVTYDQIKETSSLVLASSLNMLDEIVRSQQSTMSNNSDSNSGGGGGGVDTSTLSSEERLRRSDVSLRALENFRTTGLALGNKQVAGETPTTIDLGNIKMNVEKQSTNSIVGKKFGKGSGKDSGCSIGTGQSANGSIFVEPSQYDPNELKPSQAVVAQVIENGANIFTMAGNGSRMSSPVLSVGIYNDRQYQFPVKDLNDDSLVEVWVSNHPDAVAAIKPEVNATRPKSERMLITKVSVKQFDGLFAQVKHYTAEPIQSENDNSMNESTTFRTETTTEAATTLESTTTNGPANDEMIEYLVFISAGKAPTEQNYDHFCQLPLLETRTCSRSTARQAATEYTVGSLDGSGPDAATAAKSAAPTTVATDYQVESCNCSGTDGSGPCSKLGASATSTDVTGAWLLTKCVCNSTGCARTSGEDSSVPESVYEADRWTCFFSPVNLGTNDTTKEFFIGIRAVRTLASNRTDRNPNRLPSLDLKVPETDYVVTNYSATTFTSGCFYVDMKTFKLSSDGVYLSQCSTINSTLCYSSHLTSFMSSFVVPPIQIDPNDSAWLKLDSNPIALALVLSIVCFYFIILIWVRRKDEKDFERVGITPLMDNHPADVFRYELTFWTGARRQAGTTANVSFILYGEDDESAPRLVQDPKRPVLTRNSVDSFLMTTPYYLGKLTHLRMWHDNSGSSPKWYLNRLLIQDLQTKEKYFFICNRWFAFDEDDGMVDRILTVSGREEVRKFDVVFWSKAQKNLNDGHIWLSVVTRPPRSKFTRVQRATACLVLLLSTMMVNLMFYGQTAKVESPQLIEFGPVKFTAHSIYLATVSTLIILPVNVLVVVLFKNRRSKPPPGVKKMDAQQRQPDDDQDDRDDEKPGSANPRSAVTPRAVRLSDVTEPAPADSRLDMRQKSSNAGGTASNQNNDDDEDDEEKDKKPSVMTRLRPYIRRFWPLPWWTHYVGYCLAVVWIGVCTYLMVEFGGVLGEEKTAEWLAAMFVTLFQSIILVQPVKILVLAIVYALLVKKIEEDEDEVTRDLVMAGAAKMHQRMTMRDLSDPAKMKAFLRSRRVPPPPDLETLRALREQRIKEQAMNDILGDIMFYIIFLIILTMAAYTNQDYRSFIQNHLVKGTITGVDADGPNLDSVQRIEDLFTYVGEFAAPRLYSNVCYNGEVCDMAGPGWSWDPHLFLVRKPQLRQLRIKRPGTCKIEKYFKDSIYECRQEYSMLNDDEASYLPMWQPFNSSYPEQTEWSYTGAIKLFGIPYSGYLSTYAGGGYVASLGKSAVEAKQMTEYLRNNSWIDKHTRAVFFEFLIYNPNTNLFTFSEILFEAFNGGGFVKYPQVYTLRLNRYVGANGAFFMAVDILSLIFIVFFVYRECKELHKLGCLYFRDVFNVMDFLLLIFSCIEVVLFIIKITAQQGVSYFMKKYPERFINFQWLILWAQMNQLFLGLVVFVFTIRFLRLLSFNRKMMMLGYVLKTAAKPLGYFLVVFFIMFFAFVQLGYFMFNVKVESFKSLINCIETLGVMTLNKFDFTTFVVGGGQLGMVFFFVYMVFVSFVLINFFITIINVSFSQVKQSWGETRNKYDIADYVVKSIKSVFGINPQKRLNHIDHQFAYMAETSKFEQQVEELDDKLFELEFYIRNMGILNGQELQESATAKKRVKGKVFLSE